MKKGAGADKAAKVKEEALKSVPATAEEVKEEVPQFGFGKFEYVNQTLYVGNWKLLDGRKVKHGHGKITFPGVSPQQIGAEEYEGDWAEDKMHGFGRYTYTSGAVYTGQWVEGHMQGRGKMIYADGTSYEGEWSDNQMHGEGIYVDADNVKWQGIFVNGSFESKIQKKLKAEKELLDKINLYKEKALSYFTAWTETFARSDKKTFKENLMPFFATAETCIDYLAEPYVKYEERAPDKWNDLFKTVYDEGRVQITVVANREDSTILRPE